MKKARIKHNELIQISGKYSVRHYIFKAESMTKVRPYSKMFLRL